MYMHREIAKWKVFPSITHIGRVGHSVSREQSYMSRTSILIASPENSAATIFHDFPESFRLCS